MKITHEGIGSSLLSDKIPLSQLTSELVEEEAMKFRSASSARSSSAARLLQHPDRHRRLSPRPGRSTAPRYAVAELVRL